jgi:hypothetical protein
LYDKHSAAGTYDNNYVLYAGIASAISYSCLWTC